MRRGPKSAKSTEAKPPVSRKSPKGDGAMARELETRLAEALAREEATAEILRVISSSPADAQPVFDAIAQSAKRLCDGDLVAVFRFDETMVHAVTVTDLSPEAAEEFARAYPQRPDPHSLVGRAILDRTVVHTADVEHDPRLSAEARSRARLRGRRSAVQVPMLRGGQPIGVIGVSRREPRPFSEAQIGLLRTFAGQAVIAIENVRLFTELQERNRDLTATGEILRVIASSPTDTQPVFDTIVQNAVSLSGAMNGSLYRFDGDLIHYAAEFDLIHFSAGLESWGRAWDEWRNSFPRPLSQGGGFRQIIETREVLNVADCAKWDGFTPAARAMFSALGIRSALLVPMCRQHEVIGALALNHQTTGAFTHAHVELLKTFADQAVIAVENVRLFNETKEALEQQTATSEILRVISSSPTDIQPVLDTLVRSAARFVGAYDAAIHRVLEGDRLELVAHHGPIPYPIGRINPLARGAVSGRSVLEKRPVHVIDLPAETKEFPEGSARAREVGSRTALSVPLLREG